MAVKRPLNSRKGFVYSSPIPKKSISPVQGVNVWSSGKITHIRKNAVWNSVAKYTNCVARNRNVLMCAGPATTHTPIYISASRQFFFFLNFPSNCIILYICLPFISYDTFYKRSDYLWSLNTLALELDI
jgi:hypothetical protein